MAFGTKRRALAAYALILARLVAVGVSSSFDLDQFFGAVVGLQRLCRRQPRAFGGQGRRYLDSILAFTLLGSKLTRPRNLVLIRNTCARRAFAR